MYIKTLIFSHLLLLSTISNGQDWIQQSIDLTINTKFAAAESLIISEKNKNENSIALHFYYASVLISKMTHFENRAEEKEFLNNIQYVIEKSNDDLNAKDLVQKEKARILFYLGSAYGYLAFFQERTGEWFSAIKNARNAHDYLQQVVETDSTLWDAYLGLGSYKYWLNTKIYWIPFVKDEREKGIQLILKTIHNNAPGKALAIHQLIYILLDYGDFDLAEKIADEIIIQFPQSQFMYWAYSHVFMKKKDYKKAIVAYNKLSDLIEADPAANPNHKITCLARLMDMYAKTGNCKKARNINNQLTVSENYSYIKHNEEVERLLKEVSENCADSG